METLRPPIIRIGNRCYRRNPVLNQDTDTSDRDVTDFIPDSSGWNDETCTLDSGLVEQTADGYQSTVTAPSVLFKFIIGKKGETKRRLETETRTQIRIPRQGQEGDVVIVGHDRNGVLSAKTRVEVLLDSGRQKQPFTHFLSVPLTVKSIQDSLADFKNDILRECDGDRGIDSSIFQNPCKLHLTIGCLVLLDDSEVKKAVEVLNECRQDLVDPIMKGERLKVQLAGLEYMNDDPAEVDVLYAQVNDTTDRLQSLADRLVDRFTSTGLMQKEYDRVKLHATIMNTIFRKDPTGTTELRKTADGRRLGDRESFDATNVLKRFANYNFGNHTVSTIHLSQRHSFGPTGYYTCAASLNLT